MLKKNCPIEIFEAELRRRSSQDEANASAAGHSLSHRQIIDNINNVAKKLAKEKGLWFDYSGVMDLGIPAPSGVENDVYLNTTNNIVYKVNNLMTSQDVLSFLSRTILHNAVFPQTHYDLFGFTGFGGGSIFPVLVQDYIVNAVHATPDQINEYMISLGFIQITEAVYSNGDIVVSDLYPRNVLIDCDKDLYVIDADFKTT